MPERLFGNNKKEATVSSKVEGENVECRPYCMAMVMVFPFLLFHAVARNACCKQEEIEGQLCIYLNAHTHTFWHFYGLQILLVCTYSCTKNILGILIFIDMKYHPFFALYYKQFLLIYLCHNHVLCYTF